MIADGVDGIMLVRETGEGKYPFHCARHLARICAEAEQCIDYRAVYEDIKKQTPKRINQMETMASAAVATMMTEQIDLILVASHTGKMARYVAKYRPEVQIFACGVDFVNFKLLSCVRGVIPFVCKEGPFDMDALIEKAKELGLIKGPCKVITLLEAEQDDYDKTNEMKIEDVE